MHRVMVLITGEMVQNPVEDREVLAKRSISIRPFGLRAQQDQV